MDLTPNIRSFLLADATFVGYLATYLNSKALFTRRPVPTDATYPMGIVSPLVTYREADFVNGKKKFTITHDVMLFDTNDSSTNYRNIQAAADRVRKIMHRLDRTAFVMPAGYQLIMCRADEPIPGATDDLIKVSRIVQLTFDITEE